MFAISNWPLILNGFMLREQVSHNRRWNNNSDVYDNKIKN